MAAPGRHHWLHYFAFWRTKSRILIVTLITIGAVVSVYGLTYAFCLDGRALTTETSRGVTYVGYEPRYRYLTAFGPAWADFLGACLEPAHQVDRLVRPKRWRGPIISGPIRLK